MNNDAGSEIKCQISPTIGLSSFCTDTLYIKFNTDTLSLLSVNLKKKPFFFLFLLKNQFDGNKIRTNPSSYSSLHEISD